MTGTGISMNAVVEFHPRAGTFYLTPDRRQREAGAESFYMYPNDIRSRDEFNARSAEFHWLRMSFGNM